MLTLEDLLAKGVSRKDAEDLIKLQSERELSKVTFTKYYLGIKTNGSITDKIAFLRQALLRLPATPSDIDLSGFSSKEVNTRSLLVSIGSVASSWSLRGEHLDRFVEELEKEPETQPNEEVSALADVFDDE